MCTKKNFSARSGGNVRLLLISFFFFFCGNDARQNGIWDHGNIFFFRPCLTEGKNVIFGFLVGTEWRARKSTVNTNRIVVFIYLFRIFFFFCTLLLLLFRKPVTWKNESPTARTPGAAAAATWFPLCPSGIVDDGDNNARHAVWADYFSNYFTSKMFRRGYFFPRRFQRRRVATETCCNGDVSTETFSLEIFWRGTRDGWPVKISPAKISATKNISDENITVTKYLQ